MADAETEPSTKPGHVTAPLDTDQMPPGVPYIVGNEAAERFSFYGMKAILFVFMTEYLLDRSGELAPMDNATATEWQHNFVGIAYFFPIVGAIICDWLFGKYKTILWISLMYCVGHGILAFVEIPQLTGIDPKHSLIAALVLIAIGQGAIKPCVGAHVGDQFGKRNQHLMSKVYQWFYFAINVGAFTSTLLTPWLLREFGPGWAFGVPGVLMGLATWVFWLGRNKFVHIPPTGNKVFREIVSPDSLRALANLLPLYFIFLVVFWTLFDQTQSTWIVQAREMDRDVLGWNLDVAALQAANPILVLILVPLFATVIYPALGKFVEVTPLRKMGAGFFFGAASFAICALAQNWIDQGHTPSVWWQLLAYAVLTAGEVVLSITALEFSYSQAPKTIKSVIIGVYWLSVSAANFIIAFVNSQIASLEEAGYSFLTGENYFWTFSAASLIAGCLFAVWSQFYSGRTYIQGED